MTARDWGIAEIIRRCHAGLETASLLQELLQRIAVVVPSDAGLIATTDPATLLYTGAAMSDESHMEHLPDFLANEYLDDDVMKYAHLAGGPRRVDWLEHSTRGDPQSSPRYRALLAPLGMGDELRAAFVGGGTCWGVGCLSREAGSVPFSERDAKVVSRLGPHIAEAMRTSLLLAEASSAAATPEGPGVLLLAQDLSVIAATPAAEPWLEEIVGGHDPLLNGLPSSVINVVAALRSLETSVDTRVQPRVRIRTRAGRWLVLHASYLEADPNPGSIAVVIEPAPRSELAPLLLQAHGLTSRESEVARWVLLGYSTKELSASLFISEHTVQDHFKSIFKKVGVGSRRELVIRILYDQDPAAGGSGGLGV